MMKKLFLLCIGALIASISYAQTAVDSTNLGNDNIVHLVAEIMPEFPGGQQAMMRYIAERIDYPIEAFQQGIQGRVICQFVVDIDGRITDVVIAKSSGDSSLDREARRIIKSMPKWKPGKQNGRNVKVKYTLPVTFRLGEE